MGSDGKPSQARSNLTDAQLMQEDLRTQAERKKLGVNLTDAELFDAVQHKKVCNHVFSMYFQCIFNVFPMYFNVFSMYFQCIFDVFSMYFQCIFNVFSI